MKLIQTLYLITTTMVALPNTSAINLKLETQAPTRGEKLVRTMFDMSDSDHDGHLSRHEFIGFL